MVAAAAAATALAYFSWNQQPNANSTPYIANDDGKKPKQHRDDDGVVSLISTVEECERHTLSLGHVLIAEMNMPGLEARNSSEYHATP